MSTRGIEKDTRMSWDKLLTLWSRKESEQVTTLVVTFHPNLPHLMRILHNYQCVIDISPPHLKEALPKCPLVAYRHPPNLRDLWAGRHSCNKERHTREINSPYKHPHCKTCACKNRHNVQQHYNWCTISCESHRGLWNQPHGVLDWVQTMCRPIPQRNGECSPRSFDRPLIGHQAPNNWEASG